MSAPAVLFYVFAALAVVSALGMVLNVRNTVAAAMSLVVTMVALGGIYVLMEAHLVAVIQIMVYGGAIVVLFLFVVMLLNLRQDKFAPGRQWLVKTGAAAVGVLVLALGVSGRVVDDPTVKWRCLDPATLARRLGIPLTSGESPESYLRRVFPPGASVFSAQAQVSSSNRSAGPGMARVMRSRFSWPVMSPQPAFSGPTRFSTGTRTSSK